MIVVEEENETAPKKMSEIIPMSDLRGRGERKLKKKIYISPPDLPLFFWLKTQYIQYRCHLHHQVRDFG